MRADGPSRSGGSGKWSALGVPCCTPPLAPGRIYNVRGMRKNKIRLGALLPPHSVMLPLAFLAVLGETATDPLHPWPLKIVFHHIFGNKKMPHWLAGLLGSSFGTDKTGILHFAVAALIVIAFIGPITSYAGKY